MGRSRRQSVFLASLGPSVAQCPNRRERISESEKNVWQFRAEHPEYGTTFDRAMTEHSRGSTEAVIRAYDFSLFGHIVDIGGGQGFMLSAILRAHPHVRGTLFDQPDVVTRARTLLAERGVIERCDVVGGVFLRNGSRRR